MRSRSAGGVTEDRVQREPEHDDDRADDLSPADGLVRQEVAERQRKDDGRDEQRLDDRELSVIERDRLDDVADEQRAGADKPPAACRQPGEGTQVVRRDPEIEGSLLLKGRGDGEQERCDECENLGQSRDSKASASSPRPI